MGHPPIPYEVEAEIKRLLGLHRLTQRKIAEQVGVHQATVKKVATNIVAPPVKQPVEQPKGPIGRCGKCGARVFLPCRECKVKLLKERAAIKNHPDE